MLIGMKLTDVVLVEGDYRTLEELSHIILEKSKVGFSGV
jgi:hypothetical protein